MKSSMKGFFSMVFSLVLILVFSCNILAQEIDEQQQIDFIKASVAMQFEAKKPQLELDKYNFGLSASESFSTATLGEDTPYYVISTDYLDGQKGSYFVFEGYIYPIMVGDKNAGIIKVKIIEGEPAIVEMSSYTGFEQDIKDAQKVVGNSSTKFIYDRRFHISGLAVPNDSGYDFVPTQENPSLGLEKNRIKSFDKSLIQIQKEYVNFLANKDIVGGVKSNSNDRIFSNYGRLGLVLFFICFGSILFVRKRQHTS